MPANAEGDREQAQRAFKKGMQAQAHIEQKQQKVAASIKKAEIDATAKAAVITAAVQEARPRGNPKRYISAYALRTLKQEALDFYIHQCCIDYPTWKPETYTPSMSENMFHTDGFQK